MSLLDSPLFWAIVLLGGLIVQHFVRRLTRAQVRRAVREGRLVRDRPLLRPAFLPLGRWSAWEVESATHHRRWVYVFLVVLVASFGALVLANPLPLLVRMGSLGFAVVAAVGWALQLRAVAQGAEEGRKDADLMAGKRQG